MIKFKHYQEADFAGLVKCMESLQDFLIEMDPLKRLRRLKDYGRHYTGKLVKKIGREGGLIILALDNRKAVGCIVGIIEKQSRDNLLECISTRVGRILELFVSDECRGLGIGKELMGKMEEYFRQKKCDTARVEVFEPNKPARAFYSKLGYSDRAIDLIKPIKPVK